MTSSTTVAARIEAHLQDKLARVFAPARAAATGNADALHQMRVATRRLRVGLWYFAALFPAAELRQVQRQLRRTTRLLGEIRTSDVNLQLLRKTKPVALRRQLTGELNQVRRHQLAELRELVQTFATSRFAARIQTLLDQPRSLTGNRLAAEANAALGELRHAVRRRLRKCRTNAAAFHKLRIALKRYRYALETSAAAFRSNAAPRLRTAKRWQDGLGAYRDLEVLLEFLTGYRRRIKRKNVLASQLNDVLASFQNEHEQALAELRKLLRTKRGWLKKVKLRLPYD